MGLALEGFLRLFSFWTASSTAHVITMLLPGNYYLIYRYSYFPTSLFLLYTTAYLSILMSCMPEQPSTPARLVCKPSSTEQLLYYDRVSRTPGSQ